MEEDVGEFEISVHDFAVDKGLEGVEDLGGVLEDQLLGEGALLLDLGQHVASVAVLEHQVVVVGGLLEGQQLDDVGVVAALEHLDFVFEQLVELAWMGERVPLIMSRLMVLMATTSMVSWCLPR